MLMARLKTVVALVLVVSVIGTGVALFKDRAWADEKPAKKAPPVQPQAQNREKLKVLLKDRYAFAEGQFDFWQKKALSTFQRKAPAPGSVPPREETVARVQRITNPLDASIAQAHLYQWAQRLLTAELDLRENKADRVAAYESHLKRMKKVEEDTKEAETAFRREAEFHRLDAEIMLEREMAH